MARTSRTDYLEAALQVLAESGSDGLTVAELCSRLGVTKGSFYHHFSGVPDLVTQLLEFWESDRSRRLIAASNAEPQPEARRELLLRIAIGLPHEAEAALRSWGRSNPRVRAVVDRVDADRERHIRESMVRGGLEPRVAALRSAMAIALLVGAQQRYHPMDDELLGAMLDQLSGRETRAGQASA